MTYTYALCTKVAHVAPRGDSSDTSSRINDFYAKNPLSVDISRYGWDPMKFKADFMKKCRLICLFLLFGSTFLFCLTLKIVVLFQVDFHFKELDFFVTSYFCGDFSKHRCRSQCQPSIWAKITNILQCSIFSSFISSSQNRTFTSALNICILLYKHTSTRTCG